MAVTPNILLIEGKRAENPTFFAGLTKKGFLVETVTNGSAAITHLKKSPSHLVLINAASMRTSGKRICQSIREFSPNLPIILILDENNPNADKADANAVLTLPFTLQKLLNRIRPLLPVEDENSLSAGPFRLDVDQRCIRVNNKQISLTPRLVNLLKILIERRGEVITREDLFRLVWDTTYIGDTRTLDVHVSWLRQALEEDPRHPQYIKTVRGIGYRLDVDAFAPPQKSRKKISKPSEEEVSNPS